MRGETVMNCCRAHGLEAKGCAEGRLCPAREKAAAEFADMPITMIEPELGTMADAAATVLAAIVLVITLVLIGVGAAFVYVNWSLIWRL